MVVQMMVPTSNEAVGTPKEETVMVPTSTEAVGTPKEKIVALQVIKMDSKKKQTGMGVDGEVEIIEPSATTETVITTTVKNVDEDVDNTLPHVAQIRSLVVGVIKTSVHLRKTYTKFNKGDASVNTISRDQFETLVSHIIKKENKTKNDVDNAIHFLKDETWMSVIKGNKKVETVGFVELEKWLFHE